MTNNIPDHHRRATSHGTADDRIAAIARRMRETALYDLGFSLTPARGDGELELVGQHTRIVFETRCTHGEGRVVLTCSDITAGPHNGQPPVRTSEIRFTGSTSVADEAEHCRKQLVNLVRRADVA